VSQVGRSLVTNKVFKTTRESSSAQNGENYIFNSSVMGTLLIFSSSQTKEQKAKEEKQENFNVERLQVTVKIIHSFITFYKSIIVYRHHRIWNLSEWYL
jgi:hypothetical protein